MNEPIVTHADLPVLEVLYCHAEKDARPLLDRLIAAAKADAPPLPEGWVVAEMGDGSHRAMWHKDGGLNVFDDCSSGSFSLGYFVSVTPLRPTVTEADVERAAEAAWTAKYPSVGWGHAALATHERWRNITRAALAAAGVEVQP